MHCQSYSSVSMKFDRKLAWASCQNKYWYTSKLKMCLSRTNRCLYLLIIINNNYQEDISKFPVSTRGAFAWDPCPLQPPMQKLFKLIIYMMSPKRTVACYLQLHCVYIKEHYFVDHVFSTNNEGHCKQCRSLQRASVQGLCSPSPSTQHNLMGTPFAVFIR